MYTVLAVEIFPRYQQAPASAVNIKGLVQDCSISIANAMEILQPCTKP